MRLFSIILKRGSAMVEIFAQWLSRELRHVKSCLSTWGTSCWPKHAQNSKFKILESKDVLIYVMLLSMPPSFS